MRTALAVTASDIHLSHRCPIARTAEPDWYAVMERQLCELKTIADEYDAPLLYAGDIFHTYNPPPGLINFAINHLPKGYAIPGQHDLPHHVYKDMDKTAYGCLVSAGVIIDLLPGKPVDIGYVSPKGISTKGLVVHGFPWGFEFEKNSSKRKTDKMHVAIVHRYVWQKGSGYTGASVDNLVKHIRTISNTYDFAVFGDNHKGFQNGNVVNNGTFMRRASDEVDYQPCVSVLWSDGTIERIALKSTDDDKFAAPRETAKAIERSLDLSGFVEELAGLTSDKVDFVEALRRYCDNENVSDSVRSLLMEATGE